MPAWSRTAAAISSAPPYPSTAARARCSRWGRQRQHYHSCLLQRLRRGLPRCRPGRGQQRQSLRHHYRRWHPRQRWHGVRAKSKPADRNPARSHRPAAGERGHRPGLVGAGLSQGRKWKYSSGLHGQCDDPSSQRPIQCDFGGGTLTVAADAGITTFSDVTLDTAGTYTLQATASGLMPATTAPLTS